MHHFVSSIPRLTFNHAYRTTLANVLIYIYTYICLKITVKIPHQNGMEWLIKALLFVTIKLSQRLQKSEVYAICYINYDMLNQIILLNLIIIMINHDVLNIILMVSIFFCIMNLNTSQYIHSVIYMIVAYLQMHYYF